MSRDYETDSRPGGPEVRLEEAEALIWAMLDEQLDAAEMTRLGKMIEEDAAVRARYIECVQLHVDLSEHFARTAANKDASPDKGSSTVVLPNLLPGVSGAPGLPQIVD
jgi:hypothetical protein